MLHPNFFTNFTVTNFFSLGVNISLLFVLFFFFLHNTLSFPLILKTYLSHVNVVAVRVIMVDIILKVIMLLLMIVVTIIAKKTESDGR